MKGCVCEKFLTALAFGILLPTVASVTGLETDHLIEPGHVGLKPSFAWRMETPRAGARQAAYRIRVRRRGAQEKMVWDSGEVEDGRSVGIVYGGAPLEPARRYAWKVAVKDERGEWTESEDAHFSTGLFSDGDWSDAAWIAPSPSDGPYALRTGGFYRMLVNPKDVTEAWRSRLVREVLAEVID